MVLDLTPIYHNKDVYMYSANLKPEITRKTDPERQTEAFLNALYTQ